MTKPRELSKILTSNTDITTDAELISTVNSASAYALSEANDYTDSELSSIDLTSTINTASAAAFASASAYTDSAIASFEALPSQTGNEGKYLSTNGSTTSWTTVDALPSQTGNDGKYLTTNGASASWATLDLNSAINTASAAAVAYADGLTTSDIDEGTNLYFTNQRAINAGSATYLTITNGVAENLTVSGLFTVTGSATYVNSSNLNVTDSLINLSVEQQQADTVDQGFTASYGQPGDTEQTHKHRGFVYDVSDSKWKLFSNVAASAISTTVNFAGSNADTLVVGTLEGNVVGTSSSANYVSHTGVVGLSSIYLTQANASATYATQGATQNSFSRWTKLYSASATLISGSDDNATNLSYTPSYENLYINGILQDRTNYTATSGSTIVLNEAVLPNDIVEVVYLSLSNIANTYSTAQIDEKYNTYTRWVKTLSSSATIMTGTDDNSLSLSYNAGYESVYINGILLKRNTDYTITNSTTLTLIEAAQINDTVEIFTVTPFNIANTYSTSQSDSKFLTYTSASSIYATNSSPTFTGTVNFTSASVVGIDALPSQSGNSGKYLTTNGTIASWNEVTTDPVPSIFLLGGM